MEFLGHIVGMYLTLDKNLLLCHKVIFFNFMYLFLERGEGREKERERNINAWLPLMWPPTRDLACNPDLCSDQESNQQPSDSQPVLNPLSYTSQDCSKVI